MKDDQIVRATSAVATVASYGFYVGLNGTGDVMAGFLGTFNPFTAVLGVLLLLAFPELIDRFPVGPQRKQ